MPESLMYWRSKITRNTIGVEPVQLWKLNCIAGTAVSCHIHYSLTLNSTYLTTEVLTDCIDLSEPDVTELATETVAHTGRIVTAAHLWCAPFSVPRAPVTH